MTKPITPDFGRPNQQMSRVVHDALYLFRRQRPDDAIQLMKSAEIPLPVVERVILNAGPRRSTPPIR